MFHRLYLLKAIFFRFFVFFPFEISGYLNLFPYFRKDKGIGKKVALQAFNPQIAQVFLPLVQALRNSEKNINIYFVVMFHPYYGFQGMKDTKNYARDVLQIEGSRILYVWQTYWKKFDCLICSDVYAKFPLRKSENIIIPHGAGLLSRWIQKSKFRKTVSDFDSFFLCGNLDLLQVQNDVEQGTELHVVGFPFVDLLAKDPEGKYIQMEISGEKERKIVMYAPSWGHIYKYGDFLSQNFEEVMACLLKKEVAVLVKLHAASYVRAQAGGIAWRKRLEKYQNYENVQIIHELNDIHYFRAADILITDFSSRSFAFMITDKPIIIYGVPSNFTQTRIEGIRMKKITEASYIANNPQELSEVLDRCMKNPEEMSTQRKEVVNEVFSNLGCATNEMVRLIKDKIRKNR